jgi:predicted glycoside hydrolase/deacetylase ChbG (UPF0249 family)
VAAWHRAGQPVELGWHPALTLDRPMLPPEQVPSLVDDTGRFHSLLSFIRQAASGRIQVEDVFRELTAQCRRFLELVGRPPKLVNSHQHISVFRPVRDALHALLMNFPERPFVRRVREPWRTLSRIPGARVKRFLLTRMGVRQAKRLERDGFPGCDWLAGITEPEFTDDPHFFERWLKCMPGRTVELMCHPGYWDRTLIGRDSTHAEPNSSDPLLVRRVRELELMKRDSFVDVILEAGFELLPASRVNASKARAAA